MPISKKRNKKGGLTLIELSFKNVEEIKKEEIDMLNLVE